MKRGTYFWPLIALALVLVFNLILTPGFFAVEMRDGRLFGSLIDVLNRAVPVLLLSLGMTLVIATGGVDLSVGAVMAIAGAVAACLIARPDGCILNGLNLHGSVHLIVLVSLGAAILCGVFNGFLVGFLGLQPIVSTLLLMVAGRGVAQLLTDGQIVIFTNASFASLGRGAWLGLPMPVWIFLATWLVVAVLFRHFALGMFVEATGNNARAAQICGLNARMIKLLVYVSCAFCAGWAGLIGTADIKGADANNLGLYLELDAILAVSIGGTAMTGGRFSLVGTVIGALLMQTLTTTILTRGISPEATLVLKAIVVIVVCLLQSPVLRERAARKERPAYE